MHSQQQLVTFTDVLQIIADYREIYVLLGFGSSAQYDDVERALTDLEPVLQGVHSRTNGKWLLLYGGDPAHKDEPDVGQLARLVSEHWGCDVMAPVIRCGGKDVPPPQPHVTYYYIMEAQYKGDLEQQQEQQQEQQREQPQQEQQQAQVTAASAVAPAAARASTAAAAAADASPHAPAATGGGGGGGAGLLGKRATRDLEATEDGEVAVRAATSANETEGSEDAVANGSGAAAPEGGDAAAAGARPEGSGSGSSGAEGGSSTASAEGAAGPAAPTAAAGNVVLWGGVVRGRPVGASGFLLHDELVRSSPRRLTGLLVAGGGDIAVQELEYAHGLGVPYTYVRCRARHKQVYGEAGDEVYGPVHEWVRWVRKRSLGVEEDQQQQQQ